MKAKWNDTANSYHTKRCCFVDFDPISASSLWVLSDQFQSFLRTNKMRSPATTTMLKLVLLISFSLPCLSCFLCNFNHHRS
jgi:hypothetical protein